MIPSDVLRIHGASGLFSTTVGWKVREKEEILVGIADKLDFFLLKVLLEGIHRNEASSMEGPQLADRNTGWFSRVA